MREPRRIGIALLAAMFAALALFSAIPLAGALPEPEGVNVKIEAPAMGDIIVDDFNSDGLDDLAVASYAHNRVHFYLQNLGGLPYYPTGTLPTRLPSKIASGDVTNDGQPDIVILSEGKVEIHEKQTTDRFHRISSLPVTHPRDLAVGDCGSNKFKDIYVTGADGTTIFRQLPPGVFAPLNTIRIPGAVGNALVLAELNSDNLIDFIVASPSHISSYIQVSPNAYELGSTVMLDRNDYNPSYMSVGDVNSDGHADIVIPRPSYKDSPQGILRVLFSDSAGAFSEDNGIEYSAEISSSTLIADFDDDGTSEILVSLADGNLGLTGQSLDFALQSTPLIVVDEPEGERLLASGNFGGDSLRDIAVRIPGHVLLYFMSDAPVELVMPIPSTLHLNEGETRDNLIDLRQHFFDDFGVLHFSIAYEEDPSKLDATLDGSFLDFSAPSDWSGSLEFQVAAWDGNPDNPSASSNVFSVWINDKPRIVSVPHLDAEIDSEYTYQIVVEDNYPEWDVITYRLVRGPEGMTIGEDGLLTWTPRNPGEISVRIEVRDIFGFSDAQTFAMEIPPPPEPPPVVPPETPYVAGTTIATLTILAVAAMMSENVKWALLLLFVPLYTKIKREKVLDHFIRGQIYGYILANPGEHYNAIKQALNLTNGSLAHHLKTLEREEFIKSRKYGLYRRFYPKHMNIPEDGDFRMNSVQRHIVDVIDENPGISQKEIAKEMNITPPTVNYHIGILASAKMIHVIRQGRRTECFVERF